MADDQYVFVWMNDSLWGKEKQCYPHLLKELSWIIEWLSNYLMEKTTELNFKTIHNTLRRNQKFALMLLSKSEYLTYLVFGCVNLFDFNQVIIWSKTFKMIT